MRWPPPWLSVQGDLLHSVDCLYKVPPDSPTGQSVGVRPLKWTVGSRRAMWRRESDEAPNMINCRGLVLLSVLSLRNIVSIELESLDFPSYIIAGDSAVMSCLYKVSQVQESELDIKWYHGTSPSPFLVMYSPTWLIKRIHIKQICLKIISFSNTISTRYLQVQIVLIFWEFKSPSWRRRNLYCMTDIHQVYLPHHWETPHLLDGGYSWSLEPVLSSTSVMMFQLTNISKAQSGMYSCKVSTNSDEVLISRRLNVIGKILSVPFKITLHLHFTIHWTAPNGMRRDNPVN